jgi:hypothetical protein
VQRLKKQKESKMTQHKTDQEYLPSRVVMLRLLRDMLRIHFHYLLLDCIINERAVEFHFAVSRKTDKDEIWIPKVIIYYDRLKKVFDPQLKGKISIQTEIHDAKPAITSPQLIKEAVNIHYRR